MSSNPRPITYLQNVKISKMACGAYHSLVLVGDPDELEKSLKGLIVKKESEDSGSGSGSGE